MYNFIQADDFWSAEWGEKEKIEKRREKEVRLM